ncbi:hypothetical protein ERJ75_000486500 [Trypanosoma vivax]|nr:hypothetical protein ERJ75_000486500 [Trypanosoma vivax]
MSVCRAHSRPRAWDPRANAFHVGGQARRRGLHYRDTGASALASQRKVAPTASTTSASRAAHGVSGKGRAASCGQRRATRVPDANIASCAPRVAKLAVVHLGGIKLVSRAGRIFSLRERAATRAVRRRDSNPTWRRHFVRDILAGAREADRRGKHATTKISASAAPRVAAARARRTARRGDAGEHEGDSTGGMALIFLALRVRKRLCRAGQGRTAVRAGWVAVFLSATGGGVIGMGQRTGGSAREWRACGRALWAE